ncbi:MAG: lipocalin family protein [Pyrinomonadaceae bacterium]|nr:lipocalin family protein [Pyrinomonadaceae bacterium]
MKKLFALIVFLSTFAIAAIAQDKKDLKTVTNVDINKYSGKWFEIARYPNKFQKKCVGNVSANYTIKKNDTLEVINECLEKDGEVDRAKGKARIVDKTSNAKLEVRFAPAFLSFIPAVWGDYWIIDLDKDYKWAAIGDPDREYFWVLSREPKLDDATYQAILRRAEVQGFNPAKVVKTDQNVEVINGEVIVKP